MQNHEVSRIPLVTLRPFTKFATEPPGVLSRIGLLLRRRRCGRGWCRVSFYMTIEPGANAGTGLALHGQEFLLSLALLFISIKGMGNGSYWRMAGYP